MSEFNPFKSDFDPSVDPITADEQGLAILSKLREGKQLMEKGDPNAPIYVSNMGRLKKNLQSYSDYKKNRGERLFSYKSEVLARNDARNGESLARSAVKLLQADEDTFASMVEENGDTESYNMSMAFAHDKKSVRKDYSLNQLLKQSGYNDHEILSGAAEQHMRQRLGAKEDSSEPTVDAYLRWGLSKINEVDRRKSITEAAIKEATNQFLGMQGGGAAFEEAIEKTNPDISRDERIHLRRIRNLRFQELEKKFKSTKPLVRRLFNTYAQQEGFSTKFTEPEDSPFANPSQIVSTFGSLEEGEFENLLLMLDATAEAHGQDSDGFISNIGKAVIRSAEDVTSRATEDLERGAYEMQIRNVDKLLKGQKVNAAFIETFDAGGNSTGFSPILASGRVEGLLDGIFGDKSPIPEDQLVKEFFEIVEARYPKHKDQTGRPHSAKVVSSKEGLNRVKSYYQNSLRGMDYFARLQNWRGEIDRVKSDNVFVDNMVYGVAGSLPEMFVASNSAGVPALIVAQKNRNMAEYRQRNPDASWEEADTSAWVGATVYGLAGRWGSTRLTKKLPNTNKLISLGGEFVKRLGVEVLEESVQDLSFAATLEVFGALDEDIKDFNFMGEDGKFMDSELGAAIERAPKTALTAMPLVVGGMAGRKAVDYFDTKTYEKILQDSDLMEMYGIDPYHQANIRELSTEAALDYIKENNSEFLAEMQELDMPQVTTNAQVSIDAENNFVITDGQTSHKAKSPEEAAEVLQQVDPEFAAQFEKSEDFEFSDPSIDPEFRQEMVFHSFIAPPVSRNMFGRGEEVSRVREGLPPVPDADTGRYTWFAKKRYGLQQWLTQRKVPSKALHKSLVEAERLAQGVENQFGNIAKTLDKKVNNYVARQPRIERDATYKRVQGDAYLALRGDKAALSRLPKNIQRSVEQGRKSIDTYSQELIDTGAVGKDLAEVVGNNIGGYITRQFKVFDKNAAWTYKTVKEQHPEIYKNAIDYIKSSEGVSTKDADYVARKMLDPSRAEGFFSGNGDIKGIRVRNFIKRQDLEKPILDLLGEVRNPAANIQATGKVVSRAAITNAVQTHMAEQLIQGNLASRKENLELRHTERIGAEVFTYAQVDPDSTTGELTTGKGIRTSKKFVGFGELYVEPEMAEALRQYFEGGIGKKDGFSQAADLLATVTGVGKFMQVILNPAAYPTNFLGGVATEIFNGRISLDAKGAKAYLKRGSARNYSKGETYGVTEQRQFYEKTGAEFIKEGGTQTFTWQQLSVEMEQRGIRDNSVLAEDFNQTVERGYGSAAAKGATVLSKAYQAPDNAIKRSAFVHEVDKWAKAKPNATMDEIIQLAAEDVRSTTQNYDMVPQMLRTFSQRGVVVPTYISFTFELYRNTINTALLARKEIFSGNKVLRQHGYKRLAGMVVTGALLYGLNEGISAVIGGMGEEEKEDVRSVLPPWFDHSEVSFLEANDQKLRYFDGSYLIPHQMFYNAVSRATSKDDIGEGSKEFASSLFASVGDMNIFQRTVAEVISNRKESGGEVYNPEVSPEGSLNYYTDVGNHIFKSMYTPGVVRTYDKIKKAQSGEVGYSGSTATWDDIALNMIGVRPYTVDTSSEKFLVDNLRGFSSRYSKAKSHTSDYRQSKRTSGEQELAEKEVEKARKKIADEFMQKIRAFKALGISDERIDKAVKNSRTPKDLKKIYKEAKALKE